jgi:Mg2+/Co2+ transporter CorB
MDVDLSLGTLFALLFVLLLLSAFFSSSETALMAIDRYRLKHLSEQNNQGAILAQRLLENPDRLISLILLGNNFVNIIITQLASLIGYKISGEVGVAIATGVLTFVLLIFAEVMPKTLAVLKPERIAFPASFVYTYLMKILWPLVWAINVFSNMLLRLFKQDPQSVKTALMGYEELKSLVSSGASIRKRHQEMLLSVLSLNTATVEDIMIPRSDIMGIDLNDDWNEIEEQVLRSHFTRLLVYRDSLDNMLGFVHLRDLLAIFREGKLELKRLEQVVRPTYFTPEFTSLAQQLLNFQQDKRRIALVVDEYGEILGLVTLEDILEEIVGEFSTAPNSQAKQIVFKDDGHAWMEGSIHVRDVNKQLNIQLPTTHGKTMNGLILEYLQAIPVSNLSIMINGYPIEICKTQNNAVKTLLISIEKRKSLIH